MYLEITPEDPNPKEIGEIVRMLKAGKVGIVPTDTVYCFICDLQNKDALERLSQYKNVKLKKAKFSMVFNSISQVSEYTQQLDRMSYKELKKHLPGPFTFILPANTKVSKIFGTSKHELGVRIPNHKIINDLVEQMGGALAVTSVHGGDEILAYENDPLELFERYENQVDFFVNGGLGNIEGSTVVDLMGDEVKIIRQGLEPYGIS